MDFLFTIAEQGIVMTYSSKDGQLNLNDFDDSVCQGHLFKPCPTVMVSSDVSVYLIGDNIS